MHAFGNQCDKQGIRLVDGFSRLQDSSDIALLSRGVWLRIGSLRRSHLNRGVRWSMPPPAIRSRKQKDVYMEGRGEGAFIFWMVTGSRAFPSRSRHGRTVSTEVRGKERPQVPFSCVVRWSRSRVEIKGGKERPQGSMGLSLTSSTQS